MDIKHKAVSELTPVEYAACYKANYGPVEGYMATELTFARHRKATDARVVMLWDGPEDSTRSLIGWVLMTPVATTGLVAATPYTASKSKYTLQCWVKRPYRRKGNGALLIAEAKKYDPKPHVMPHDDPSGELFSCFDVQVMKQDKFWMKKKPKIS